MEQAESRLRHSVLVGITTPRYDKVQGKDRRKLVQEEVPAAVEEEQAGRMVGMRQQGAWIRWEQAVERKVIWTELWKASAHTCSTKPI